MFAWPIIAAVTAVSAVDSLIFSIVYPGVIEAVVGFVGAAALSVLVGLIVIRIERLEQTVGLRAEPQKADVNDGAF